MIVIPVGLHLLQQLSTLRISIPQDLRPADNRRSVMLQLKELVKRHRGGPLPQVRPKVTYRSVAWGL
jgi:ATP-dependent RNA helicase DOB1